ncbi:hypothetical protein K461DRAFT_280202 [Myriangium duriaei CBS 260.36]|uniref:Uncharacterized protein n=1 Tax=Myriangium duriaei CBS 260.36 TaxID=1168546 RepID=A0A9P4J2W6_9PEZI|nr:hypothetical protein K461DRAFT_280202 [Myriangium duriaei CBS 260.36]
MTTPATHEAAHGTSRGTTPPVTCLTAAPTTHLPLSSTIAPSTRPPITPATSPATPCAACQVTSQADPIATLHPVLHPSLHPTVRSRSPPPLLPLSSSILPATSQTGPAEMFGAIRSTLARAIRRVIRLPASEGPWSAVVGATHQQHTRESLKTREKLGLSRTLPRGPLLYQNVKALTCTYPFILQLASDIPVIEEKLPLPTMKKIEEIIGEYRVCYHHLFVEHRRLGGYYHRFSLRARMEISDECEAGLGIWNEYMAEEVELGTVRRLLDMVDGNLQLVADLQLDFQSDLQDGLHEESEYALKEIVNTLGVACDNIRAATYAMYHFWQGMAFVEAREEKLVIEYQHNAREERKDGRAIAEYHFARIWVESLPEYQERLEKGVPVQVIVQSVIWSWPDHLAVGEPTT